MRRKTKTQTRGERRRRVTIRATKPTLLELPKGALSQTQAEDLAGLDKTAAANAAAARLAMAAPAMRAEFAFAAHHPTYPTVKLVRGG